ncbi:MAG: FG-GAP repeat protein [Planctomycetota bacterium]
MLTRLPLRSPLLPVLALCAGPAAAQHAEIGDHRLDTELQPLVGASNLSFGADVDVSGDLALIGVAGDSTAGSFEGAVSVRSRNVGGPGAWGETMTLLPPDPSYNNGAFGGTVALSGNLALVTSRQFEFDGFDGEVHFMNASTGALTATVRTTDPEINFFGRDTDTDGTTVIIGAERYVTGPPFQQFVGKAYLYDPTGVLQLVLTPSDGASNWAFATAVAVDGAYAVVGAYGADASQGAVYVYDTATGAELYKLTASDGAAGDEFGRAVAIEGTRALIGAPRKGSNNIGGAYLFDLATGAELTIYDDEGSAPAGAGVGWSVALAGDRAYVGVPSSLGWVGFDQYVGRIYAFDLDYGYAVHWYDNPDSTDFNPSGMGWQLAADGATMFDGNSGASGAVAGLIEGRAYTAERRDAGLGISVSSAGSLDPVTFTTRGGAPGGLVGTAVVAIDGVPVAPIPVPGSVGLLDGNGESVYPFVIPIGLAGTTTLTMQSLVTSKSGAFAFSNTRDLKIF